MSGHTPGPWKTDGDQIWAEQDGHLRQYVGMVRLGEPQRVSNARLMAAAPTMLGALEAVMEFWGRDPLAFGDEASINSLAGRFAAVADQCRLARNAARGLEDA